MCRVATKRLLVHVNVRRACASLMFEKLKYTLITARWQKVYLVQAFPWRDGAAVGLPDGHWCGQNRDVAA